MPLVLVASTTSCAVTTVALGLATVLTAAQAPVVLVEADTAGGVLSARHARPSSPGLLDLATMAAMRTGGAAPPLVAYARPLRIADHDVPTVLAPASATLVGTALVRLVERGAGLLNPPDGIVIVDRGRLDAGVVTAELVRRADLVLMVVQARVDELARLWQRIGEFRSLAGRLAVILTPNGEYPAGEVARMLGARLGGPVVVGGPLPHDRGAARVLDGQHAAGRHFARSRLLTALDDTARRLVHPLLGASSRARHDHAQRAA